MKCDGYENTLSPSPEREQAGMMLGAALSALVPFESSKKLYLVETAAAQGKADARDKDENKY